MQLAESIYSEGSSAVPPIARFPEEWTLALASRGERAFRAQQIFRWIHRDNVMDANGMGNLPRPLRAWLAESGVVPPVSISQQHKAPDTTHKLALTLADGNVIETVLIPMLPRTGGEPADADLPDPEDDADDESDAVPAGRVRVTQCISTQVGCAMRCAFCASGEKGLVRHLGPEEIVAQVLLGRSLLAPEQALTNIVVMGMGEPLHNYDATARALRLIAHKDGIGLSKRRITVSTVGVVSGIQRLGRDFEGRIGLAVSLHASDDETRARIVPVAKKYPLRDIITALREYPLPPHRRLTIEYALIDGVNDRIDHAKRLAELLAGLRVKVNLIPMNPVANSALRPPPWDRVLAFQFVLQQANCTCLIRRRRGDNINAACGQLAATGKAPRA